MSHFKEHNLKQIISKYSTTLENKLILINQKSKKRIFKKKMANWSILIIFELKLIIV